MIGHRVQMIRASSMLCVCECAWGSHVCFIDTDIKWLISNICHSSDLFGLTWVEDFFFFWENYHK